MTKTAEEIVNETIMAAIKLKGIKLSEFRERNNGKREVVRARHLVAYVLSKHFNQSNQERVMFWLDCSVGFVRIANRLAHEPGGDGESFRKDLAALNTLLVGPAAAPKENVEQPKKDEASASTKGPALDPQELLLRIAQEKYGFSCEDILKRNSGSSIAHVRKVLLHIANEFFGMKTDAITRMLGYNKETVRRLMQETKQDCKYDISFGREINDLCKEFGIEKVVA